MKTFTRLLCGVLAALLIAAPATGSLAADTVRASANIRIYDGPGERYAVIGVLKKDARVTLARCNNRGTWCLFRDREGNPVGWVRASYLIGIGAITQATPFHFLVNPDFAPKP